MADERKKRLEDATISEKKKGLEDALIGAEAEAALETEEAGGALITGQDTGKALYETHGENDVTELIRNVLLYKRNPYALVEYYKKKQSQNLEMVGPLSVGATQYGRLKRQFRFIGVGGDPLDPKTAPLKIGIEMRVKAIRGEDGRTLYLEAEPSGEDTLYTGILFDFILYKFRGKRHGKGADAFCVKFPLSEIYGPGKIYKNKRNAREGFIKAAEDLMGLVIYGESIELINGVRHSRKLIDIKSERALSEEDVEFLPPDKVERLNPVERPVYYLFVSIYIDDLDNCYVWRLPYADFDFLEKYDMDRPPFLWEISELGGPRAYYFADEIFREMRQEQTKDVAEKGCFKLYLRTIRGAMRLPDTQSRQIKEHRKDNELIKQPIWSAAERIQRLFDENRYTEAEITGIRREALDGRIEYSGETAVKFDQAYYDKTKHTIDDYLDYGYYEVAVRGTEKENADMRAASREKKRRAAVSEGANHPPER